MALESLETLKNRPSAPLTQGQTAAVVLWSYHAVARFRSKKARDFTEGWFRVLGLGGHLQERDCNTTAITIIWDSDSALDCSIVPAFL